MNGREARTVKRGSLKVDWISCSCRYSVHCTEVHLAIPGEYVQQIADAVFPLPFYLLYALSTTTTEVFFLTVLHATQSTKYGT